MIVIIDDEYFFALQLKRKLKKFYKNEKIKILTKFDFEFIANNNVDTLFLDIELANGENGIEMARMYREQIDQDEKLNIVFISSHDSYVYSTFGVRPVDFIRKGNLDEDLERCINLIKQKKKRDEMETIIEHKVVKLTDVIYVESKLNYVYYVLKDGTFIKRRAKLSIVEKELEKYRFIRCHSSYVVNVKHITAVYKEYVVLRKNIELPISASKRIYFLEKCADYLYRNKK
ncbi:MAG: LytTR family DNA-binding domain-containing protein [Thomasclavelia sp.]